MNNILTEIGTLLTDRIDEEFEISELADCPILSLSTINGSLGASAEGLDDETYNQIVEKYKFNEILPSFGVDFTVIGYVCYGEFFLFAVFMRGEEHEVSPERRANFIELFNSNPQGIKMRHVPVFNYVLSLPGAKRALENKSTMKDVSRYTIQAITEQCEGISPMTKLPRKGLVFKSLQSDFKFKVFSESYMLTMGE